MAKLKYLQIDSDILGNNKISVMLRRLGVKGLGVYMYYLIGMAQATEDKPSSIEVSDIFNECASCLLDISKDDFINITNELIKITLLSVNDEHQIYSEGFNRRTGKLLASNKQRGETLSKTKQAESQSADSVVFAKANDEAKPQATAKAKPVVKESLTPESEQITRLRGYAKAIFDEIGSSKNKPELTTEQYQQLIDKWGYDKLVQLQRVYYEWKASLTKKHTHTDIGTLLKGGWVLEKVDKLNEGCQEQYDSGNTPTPEQRENPPSGGWLYPFPKPEGLDGMEFYAKKELLSKLMHEYEAAKEAKNPKPVKTSEPPKEDVWEYGFPKPEFWDGMKQAAKDAYVQRELMKEAADVINSLPT